AREFAADIAHEVKLDFLAELAAKRKNCRWLRKRSDVHPIAAIIVAAKHAVAQLNCVSPIGGNKNLRNAILSHKRMIVGQRNLVSVAVEDCNARIKQCSPQSQAFDHNG